MGIRPLAQQKGRTLVPPNAILSPGANCDSAPNPFGSSLGTASLLARASSSARAGYRSPPHAAKVFPGAACTSQSHEATEYR